MENNKLQIQLEKARKFLEGSKEESKAEEEAQVIGKGVANYTDSWTLYDNSGSGFARTVGTAVPTYKAYRSNQPGAFDDNLILNLELKYS